MSAETNARHHVEAFRWWVGNPEMTEEEAGLRDLSAIRKATEELIATYAADAKQSGLTWDQIGDALGVSRQAAQKRYGPRRNA